MSVAAAKFSPRRRPVTNTPPARTVSEAVDSRRSIRVFTPRAVSRALLHQLLLKSARTPSGGNVQPWKVYVLSPTKRDELVRVVSRRIAVKDFEREGYPIYPAAMSKWEGARARYMDYRRTLGYQMYRPRHSLRFLWL